MSQLNYFTPANDNQWIYKGEKITSRHMRYALALAEPEGMATRQIRVLNFMRKMKRKVARPSN